jgi:hypothetical protein
VSCWRVLREGVTPLVAAAVSGARAIVMPHADYVCAILEAGNVVCQGFAEEVKSVRVELPNSSGAVSLEAGSGGLALCAVDAAHAWQCWNLPSYVFESMGIADVAGVFPFVIDSDRPLRELAIGGFRVCVLRDDTSVACVDAADEANAVMLLQEMRVTLSKVVPGLPE